MSRKETVDRLLGRREHGREKTIVTPEGVPLVFTIAPPSARFLAFMIDVLLILAGFLGIGLAALLLGAAGLPPGLLLALLTLAFFLLRNFYFIVFETRGHGATPGKRKMGTRVIDRRGGPLTTGAVFARNLTRELEVFLPFVVVAAPDRFFPGAPGGAVLLAGAWLLVVALLPLLNRERLRVGDLAAGTIVVLTPREALLRDLAAPHLFPRDEDRVCRFTAEQLGIYGIYELQVLEDLLRGGAGGDRRALEKVARKIRKKIGWKPEGHPPDPRRFLRDFYTAQRAHLERRLLLGERRERKEEATRKPPRSRPRPPPP